MTAQQIKLPPPGRFAGFPNELRHELASAGMKIVEPGDGTFKSFSLKYWDMCSFLAKKDNKIYIALIRARKPFGGALSRLFNEIYKLEFKIAAIAPIGDMEVILSKWGFEPRKELIGGKHIEEVWYRRNS